MNGQEGLALFADTMPVNARRVGANEQSVTTSTATHSITSLTTSPSSADDATCSTTAGSNPSPSWRESISRRLYELGGVRPYYSDEATVIIHADCRDILPLIEPGSVDLVLTDPPYGMNYKPLRGADGSRRWDRGVTGDADPFDPALLLPFGRCILFGANWYADKLPPSGGWVVWDKTPFGAKEGFYASHAELAWTNISGSVTKFSLQWGGEARNKEPFLHPTQKPVALMRWLVERYTNPGDLILDPYMGSGPIAWACSELGRFYIGIEIEERYCEIAARRMQQTVMAFA